MRKLIIMSLFLLYIIGLAPALCQAGASAYGEDPFAPVASSDMNNPGSTNAGAKSLTMQSMTSNRASGAAVSTSNFTTGWPLENIAPKDLYKRINLFTGDLASVASVVIIPLAVLSMLVSCIILVLGSLIGWGAAKRFGLGGLIMACAGLLVYYGYPLIIGLIRILVGRLI